MSTVIDLTASRTIQLHDRITRELDKLCALEVAAEAARVLGFPLAAACTDCRRKPYPLIRHAVWWALYTHTALSWPTIGAVWGVDHTTAMAGARRHAADLGLLVVDAAGAARVAKAWRPMLARPRVRIDVAEAEAS